jgi:hypothetical protein
MIRTLVARFTLLSLAAACGRSSEVATPTDQADVMAQARARGQELANAAQSYQPVRFVSAIEQVQPPRPVTRRKVEDVVKKGVDSVVVEPVTVPLVVTEPDQPVVSADSLRESAGEPRVPSIIPRAAPLPETSGHPGSGLGEWRGRDPGPEMGTVIGVVLRGGRGDPGHCPRHPTPPSQIPNRIPR